MIAHSIMYVNVKKAGINLGQLDLGWGGKKYFQGRTTGTFHHKVN